MEQTFDLGANAGHLLREDEKRRFLGPYGLVHSLIDLSVEGVRVELFTMALNVIFPSIESLYIVAVVDPAIVGNDSVFFTINLVLERLKVVLRNTLKRIEAILFLCVPE